MADDKTVAAEPQDEDAMLNGGQADYGSAGQQALDGVNGAKTDATPPAKPAD